MLYGWKSFSWVLNRTYFIFPNNPTDKALQHIWTHILNQSPPWSYKVGSHQLWNLSPLTRSQHRKQIRRKADEKNGELKRTVISGSVETCWKQVLLMIKLYWKRKWKKMIFYQRYIFSYWTTMANIFNK